MEEAQLCSGAVLLHLPEGVFNLITLSSSPLLGVTVAGEGRK